MVTQFEDFLIYAPYTRTVDDDEAIAKASPNNPQGDDWEKSCLKDFKIRVRDYLRPIQHGRCAYCRCKIHENNASPEVEHIVPKDKRPDFMYEPRNYCLSCHLCNSKKSYSKPVLKDETVKELPEESGSYLLINPYTDKYSDEIDIIDGILYKGIGAKGLYTIELCGLNRIQYALDRADEVLDSERMDYVGFMQWLIKYDHTALVDNWDEFVRRIKGLDAIQLYKQNNGMI